MPQRLITFVLLVAYGFPAAVGEGLHLLQEAVGGCSACDVCHQAPPETTPAAGQPEKAGCSHAHHGQRQICVERSNRAGRPDAAKEPRRPHIAVPHDDDDAPAAPAWERPGHDVHTCPVCRYLAGSLALTVCGELLVAAALLQELPVAADVATSPRLMTWFLARGPPLA